MPKILFVDDDAAGAEPVVRYLQKSGLEISQAGNGREALNALTAGKAPDLILLDVRMPQMDGLELLAILRSYLRWQHIPVILLTAYADLPAVTSAANQFHADVVNKAGIELSELQKLVEQRVRPSPPAGAVGQVTQML